MGRDYPRRKKTTEAQHAARMARAAADVAIDAGDEEDAWTAVESAWSWVREARFIIAEAVSSLEKAEAENALEETLKQEARAKSAWKRWLGR